MTTALTVSGDGAGDIGLMELGKILVASGFFKDSQQHAQAITKVLLGRELGLTPMASMIGLHVIDGKPSVGSHVIAAGIKKSGRYDYKVLHKDNERCSIEFFGRPGPGQKLESLGVETFDMADAKRAGLHTRPPWVKTPKAMLFARAIGQGYRTYCPDALSMLAYAEGELEAPIDVEATPAEHAPAPDDGKPARQLKPLEGGKKPAAPTQEIRRPDPTPAEAGAQAARSDLAAHPATVNTPIRSERQADPTPAPATPTAGDPGAAPASTSPAAPAGNPIAETLASQPATPPDAAPKRKPRRD